MSDSIMDAAVAAVIGCIVRDPHRFSRHPDSKRWPQTCECGFVAQEVEDAISHREGFRLAAARPIIEAPLREEIERANRLNGNLAADSRGIEDELAALRAEVALLRKACATGPSIVDVLAKRVGDALVCLTCGEESGACIRQNGTPPTASDHVHVPVRDAMRVLAAYRATEEGLSK